MSGAAGAMETRVGEAHRPSVGARLSALVALHWSRDFVPSFGGLGTLSDIASWIFLPQVVGKNSFSFLTAS